MKKLLFIATLGLMPLSETSAQSSEIISDPVKLMESLKKEKFDAYPNAKAVILYREQTSYITDGYLENTYNFIAKILSDDAAQDLSLINISKQKYDMVYSVSGETFNLTDGKITSTEMEKNEVQKEKIIKNLNVIKFNLPGVKKGSIIHYSYKTKKPAWIDIPDYYLQKNYPILLEYYTLTIPSYITFQKIERINAPVTTVRSIKDLDTCEAGVCVQDFGTNGSALKWVRKNVPAFEDEPFMSSQENFMERIKIQVTSVVSNGRNNSVFNNWSDFTKKFYYDDNDYVSSVFKANGFLDDKIEELTKNAPSEIEKASSIYKFIRDSFTVKSSDKDFSLRSIYNDRSGPENSINLLLIAMLRRAKLDCQPLLVGSAKDKERMNPVYPNFYSISQLVARLTIEKKSIYLDATEKQMPFGKILPDYYCGYAQVVDQKPIGISLEPSDIMEKSLTMVSIKPSSEKGKMLMQVDCRLGDFEAYNFRKTTINDTTIIKKNIIKSLSKGSLNAQLTNWGVENLNNPDGKLKIHYEATFTFPEEKIVYLNLYIDPFFETNPFPATKRHFPVEMEYVESKNYIVNLSMPEGYAIDDYPKPKIYKYDEAGKLTFKNLLAFDASSNTFNINSQFQTSATYFSPNEYDQLRNFYGKIVDEQNQKIVLKKLN